MQVILQVPLNKPDCLWRLLRRHWRTTKQKGACGDAGSLEKRNRRARTAHGILDLGIGLWLDGGFLHRLGDFVFEFLTGFLEFTHAAAQTAGKFRKFLGTEEQENGEEDQEPFLSTWHSEGEKWQRIHLSGSLGRGSGIVKGKFRSDTAGPGGRGQGEFEELDSGLAASRSLPFTT